MHTGRHAALYGLGRLEEADEEYRTIERLCPAVLDRADATAVQVRSVTHRTRFAEAVGLGLESLRELGITVPAADRLPAELDHQFDYWYRWLDHTEAADDLARPDLTDPVLLAASGLINATLTAAFFARRPGHGHLAGRWKRCGSALSTARPLPWSSPWPTPPSVLWCCAATTPPGTGRRGGSWRWAKPAATSPAPPRCACYSLSSAAGPSRSKTVSIKVSRRGRD